MGNAVRKAQLLGAVLAASGAWLSPAAADYEVILATDTDPGTAGQLRYGLENASGTLFFSQTAFPPGTATAIVLAADLVLSADNLVVDGFYSGQGSGDVVIDGDGYRCLAIDGDGNTVRGLTLTGGSVGAEISGSYNRFGEEGFPNQVVDNETSGVLVSGGDDNSIEGNYIGLTSSGAASGNGGDGIRIEGGSGATVGGAGTGRNVVAANGGYGISVNRGGAGAVRTGIRNNYIGTDPTGAAALANGLGGVSVWSAAETVVGGDSAAGEGNLVSGHGSAAGIWFNACTGAGNGVWGNLVGTDASGLLSVPNREGLLLTDSSGIEVGAPGGYLNVFSGNSFCGIRLTQQVASPPATVDNLLRSNLVGLGADGVSAVANGQGRDGDAGIVIEGGAGGNQVGDTGSGEGNLVGENLGDGILLDDSGNNVLRGNLLGTDGAGAALGNLFSGVRLRSGAAGNLLEENTAAFNGQSGERDGVRIEGSGSTSDLVSRNSTYDNAGLGIRLLDGANQGVGPPAIVEVTWTSPSSARVAGTRSLGCGVEVYRADVSGSGPGEGMLYLGSAPLAVSTVWTVETAAGISEGDWLTAVQFTSLSSTSEFCENRLFAPESPTPSPTAVPTASPSPSPTVSPTPSPTISPVPTATPPPTPTPRPAEELYSFPLDTDPGWTVESDWAFGVPAGWGGGTDPINQGYPDPNSGHTGANVYGYNLEGNYPNDMPEYFLTTGPIDCSAATQIKLVFWRWLNVEAATHDYARIEYTTDGEEWVRIYQNLPPPINTTDSAWTVMTYQVQAAGYQPQVRFRWGMGPSDNIRTFSGWNIDDIEIWGVPQATRTPPPTATPTPSATPTSAPTATPPPGAPPTPSPVTKPPAAQPLRV
ncbi:MAG TPA: right-handed parallel beta-helix repeat-containing protein, partial [bacterium]|nr:right-handed parallel beta-helix repeat-containing protein [bacterium]